MNGALQLIHTRITGHEVKGSKDAREEGKFARGYESY